MSTSRSNREESAEDEVCETSTNNNNSVNNRFANDGSFMQMFMNLQRQQTQPMPQRNSATDDDNANHNKTTVSDYNQNTDVSSSTDNLTTAGETSSSTAATTATTSVISSSKPSSTVISTPVTGKRRIRKTLKVGVIKKQRPDTTGGSEDNGDDTRNNAWARYMNEVRKYKEKFGDDGDKNRPLVK